MKHLFILLFLCQGILAQAQTRLSEMPWHERDSIITAKVKRFFNEEKSRNYDDCVTIIRQRDNDMYNINWVAVAYDSKASQKGVWRTDVPSDSYLYDVRLYGERMIFGGDYVNRLVATALLDENLDVLMTSMTDDCTLYWYKYDMNDRVTGVFDHPTRRPTKYKRPTDEQLHSDEYAWGKSIASLSKDERIRVLTGIAFNALETLDGFDRKEAVLYPVISESTFKFIGHYWLPEKELDVRPSEVPRGMSPDDIYHRVEIYWEKAKRVGYATSQVAVVYITDKDHRAFVVRRNKRKDAPPLLD